MQNGNTTEALPLVGLALRDEKIGDKNTKGPKFHS
mgnify:CR=1 FL=1